jgi:CRISPR-associated endonuclease Cas1/CRISPR-associated protein Cas4
MLNEFTYCPRLFYLEWVQKEWADNVFTLDGDRVHQRVDRPNKSARGHAEAPVIRRSVELSDDELGLVAKLDLLETEDGTAVPVDYKRGSVPNNDEGAWDPEKVQLCAQALLLRAHGFRCERGVLWYAASRRRIDVEFTEKLVELTRRLILGAREIAEAPRAPPPLKDSPKCEHCSLIGICLPDEHAFLKEARIQHRMRKVRPRIHESLPLHVTEAGSVIRKDGDELVVEPRTQEARRVRLLDVSSVQLHGSVKVTTPALHALLRAGVPITYLTGGGFCLGRTRGPSHKNVELRLAQYHAATDPDRSLVLARRFVVAKIKNCRTLIRRNVDEPQAAMAELDKLKLGAGRAKTCESLLGIEGQAAAVHFRAMSSVLRLEGDEKQGAFARRSRRPPKDPVNALLSFVYSLLTTTWTETVERVGFDPYLGFYHRPRYGRPALSLDLMEEFRPLVADSVVLGLLRRGEVSEDDFDRSVFGCSMRKACRRRVIASYERRIDEQIKHPVFGYRVSYRQVFEVQARLLSRYLTGEIDSFPEFTTR